MIAFPWTQPALNSQGHHYSNTQKSTLFSLYLASSTVLRLKRTRFWKLPSTLVSTWGDCFVSACFINVISPSVLTSYQETRCFGHSLEEGNRGASSSAGLTSCKIPGWQAHGKTQGAESTKLGHMLISTPLSWTTRIWSLRLHPTDDLVLIPPQSLASMHYNQVNFNMGSLLGHSDQSQIMAPSKSKCLEELDSEQ